MLLDIPNTYIHSKGNICILSAEGTAAIIDSSTIIDGKASEQTPLIDCSIFHIPEGTMSPFAQAQQQEHHQRSHRTQTDLPMPKEGRCNLCDKGQVPELLLSTCELPPAPSGLFTKQHFIEARICRPKKRKIGESNGKCISQLLPFAEYDLHKQLLYKMKLYHVNAIFNLSYNIAVSDFYIVVTVNGTGVHIPALPESSSLSFVLNEGKKSRRLINVHKQLQALSNHFNNVDLETPRALLLQQQRQLLQQEKEQKRIKQKRAKLIKKANKGKRRDTPDDNMESDTSTTNSILTDSEDEQETKSDSSADESPDEEAHVITDIDQVAQATRKLSIETDNNVSSSKRIRKATPLEKPGYLVEIDDETDEDNMIALMDPLLPSSISLSNFRGVPSLGSSSSIGPLSPNRRGAATKTVRFSHSNLQNIVIQKRYSLLNRTTINNEHDLSAVVTPLVGVQEYLSTLYHDLYTTLAFKLQLIVSGHDERPVKVCGLSDNISFSSDHEVLITLQAMAIVDLTSRSEVSEPVLPVLERVQSATIPELLPHKAFMPVSNAIGSRLRDITDNYSEDSNDERGSNTGQEELFEMEPIENDTTIVTNTDPPTQLQPPHLTFDERDSSEDEDEHTVEEDDDIDLQWINKDYVTITPLYFVPGARIKSVIGKVSQHLIRESDSVPDFGTFQQEVVMEANAVIRAHTKALGANALLNYQIVYHKVLDNPYRKQAYTLLTVSGDAAEIEFQAPTSKKEKSRRDSKESTASALELDINLDVPIRSRSSTVV
jgi:hypothetical protein